MCVREYTLVRMYWLPLGDGDVTWEMVPGSRMLANFAVGSHAGNVVWRRRRLVASLMRSLSARSLVELGH